MCQHSSTSLVEMDSKAQPFDRALSLRIDAIVKALDDVRAWPDSAAKRKCMAVLSARLRQLEARVTA